MNEFLSSGAGITHKKYYRLMVIACLDTLFNIPVLITNLVTDILQGQDNGLNYPYISWENVHNGAGGNLPGFSLSSILQTPASGWSTDKWNMFEVKWDEWVYVLHAITFFIVFGTTPEMCQYYRSALWFMPERLGYKRRRAFEVETLSDVAFTSNPGQQTETRVTTNSRRGSLFILETSIGQSATRSDGVLDESDLEEASTHHAM